MRQHVHGLYVQDDWRVTAKLTVNMGLRWDFATPIWERDNLWSNFNPPPTHWFVPRVEACMIALW